MNESSLIKIFCEIDDFCKSFDKQFSLKLLTDGSGSRDRKFSLTMSEIMTILIWFNHSGYRTFKDYYTKHMLVYMRSYFPKLVSYTRFIELKQKALLMLTLFSKLLMGECTGISFIDSFSLAVCNNRRIHSHKVCKSVAERGKTSVGWFYGFKLHLIVNQIGEIIAFYITSGNVADNSERVLAKLTKKLFGKIFGDKGYIINPDLFEELYNKGIHIVTKLRKNMKNKLMTLEDKLGLRKRGIVETVGGVMKESLSLEHSRHRSIVGFFVHVVSTLIAYSYKEKKPSIESSSILVPLLS